MPRSTADSEKQRKALSKLETIWMFILRDYRKVYPSSEIAKMDAEGLEDTARSWTRILSSIPESRVRDVYEATVCGSKFPPAAPEFLATWETIHGDENRRHNETEWKRHDEQVRKALPQGKAGPGEIAHQLFMKRGDAVVCDCPPKNGYQWPARLNTSCTAWECQQNPRCQFYCLVEHTVGAPKPRKTSELRDSISREGPKSSTMPESPAFKAAREAGYDPDEMTPRQFVQWQQFFQWWSEKFVDNRGRVATMTQALVEQQWPIFAGITEPVKVESFTQEEATAIYESNCWMDWDNGLICAVQVFCEFRCVPEDIFEIALNAQFGRTVIGDLAEIQAEYLTKWPQPNIAGLRSMVATAINKD